MKNKQHLTFIMDTISIVTNEDCMEMMSRYPDKFFELAVVDPPYGVGEFQQTSGDTDKYNLAAYKKYGAAYWNKIIPNMEYFNELLRVSKNQIIWGANYFNSFPKIGGAIIWDKETVSNRFSECDIASCSFHKKIVKFRYRWSGFLQERMDNKEERIHSCQKPIALYNWIFKNYAKEGDKILDTHLGSGSSRIAAYKAKLDFYGCELDKDYYESQEDRFKKFVAQLTLW